MVERGKMDGDIAIEERLLARIKDTKSMVPHRKLVLLAAIDTNAGTAPQIANPFVLMLLKRRFGGGFWCPAVREIEIEHHTPNAGTTSMNRYSSGRGR